MKATIVIDYENTVVKGKKSSDTVELKGTEKVLKLMRLLFEEGDLQFGFDTKMNSLRHKAHRETNETPEDDAEVGDVYIKAGDGEWVRPTMGDYTFNLPEGYTAKLSGDDND